MKKIIDRRTLIKSGAAAIAMPALLNANSASAQAKVIKIGHVSPRTGPLARHDPLEKSGGYGSPPRSWPSAFRRVAAQTRLTCTVL